MLSAAGPDQRPGRRPDLEGLRGLAILMVVAYHARLPLATGGFVGVDIFFVISGYLIAGQLARELAATGRVRLLDFYARRARRLLPAAALAILTTVLIARLLLSPLEQSTFAATAVAAGMYVSNVWFALRATDYLAAPSESNPLLHMWSLSVEEQFYLVWPFVLLLAWRASRLAGAIAATLGIVLLSAGLMLALNNTQHAWTFFGPHTRAWEFGVGALAALVPWRIPTRLAGPAAWAGLAAALTACVAYDIRTPFPGATTAVPVVGTALVILAGDRRMTALLSGLQWFGRVSYSWYLWHWPVVVFAATLAPSRSPVGRIVASIAALGLAVVSQRLLEDRIRFSAFLQPRPQLTLALAALLTLVTLGTITVWQQVLRREMDHPQLARYLAMREDHPTISTNGCHLAIEAIGIRDCDFGAESSVTVVVLYGDSHAAQLFPAIEALSRNRGWRLVPITKMACPVAEIPSTVACDSWRRDALARIRALNPAFVFVTSASLYIADGGRLAGVSDATWSTGTHRALKKLEGIRTVLLADLPQPGFDPVLCLARKAWHAWLPSDCSFSPVAVPSVTRAAALEQRAAANMTHVRMIDLTDAICLGQRCDPMRDGLVRYRDDNHITARFSRSLAGPISARLDRLVWQ